MPDKKNDNKNDETVKKEKKLGKHSIPTKIPLPSKRFIYRFLTAPIIIVLLLTFFYLNGVVSQYRQRSSGITYSGDHGQSISRVLGKQKIFFPILNQIYQAKASNEIITTSLSSPTFGFGTTASLDYLPQDVALEGDFLNGKVIVIDPAHGDPGNQGPFGPGGTKETEIVLDIAKRLRDHLEEDGAKVVMTRLTETTQLNNVQRGELANSEKANLFIRIRADGIADRTLGGTQVTYNKENSVKAAEIFHGELLKKKTGLTDLGYTKGYSQGLTAANVPAISINVANIKLPAEENWLKNSVNRKNVALALYDSTKRYLLTVLS